MRIPSILFLSIGLSFAQSESVTRTSFPAHQVIKGKLFDVVILNAYPYIPENRNLAPRELGPGQPWTVAVTSHDKTADEFIADISYRNVVTSAGKTEAVVMHVILNGPAKPETAVRADNTTEIPLKAVETIQVRLLKKASQSELRIVP